MERQSVCTPELINELQRMDLFVRFGMHDLITKENFELVFESNIERFCVAKVDACQVNIDSWQTRIQREENSDLKKRMRGKMNKLVSEKEIWLAMLLGEDIIDKTGA